jgi:hypothetical protein
LFIASSRDEVRDIEKACVGPPITSRSVGSRSQSLFDAVQFDVEVFFHTVGDGPGDLCGIAEHGLVHHKASHRISSRSIYKLPNGTSLEELDRVA